MNFLKSNIVFIVAGVVVGFLAMKYLPAKVNPLTLINKLLYK